MPKERYQQPTLRQTQRGVWFFRAWVDRIREGRGAVRVKETITIGVMGKREAQAKMREKMATINRADYVVSSQINFGAFLRQYEKLHVEQLSSGTQARYRSNIRIHVEPAFGKLMLCEMTTMMVKQWLDGKEKLSWSTKTDLRNLMHSIYSKASEWDLWKDRNPIEHVHVGRKQLEREFKKLSEDETRRLLAALPWDVRLMCYVCLFGTLRISEALGLQEKHLDFERGQILIRQRFYRGDLDRPKSQKSRRDVPMGYLADDLKRLCQGDPERFVFQIETHPKWGRETAICRDDRDINQHFLRPAAKALGIYRLGFGFHALRREAITQLGATLGPLAAQRMAGHTRLDMTYHYTLADEQRQAEAVKAFQEQLIGKTGEKVQ